MTNINFLKIIHILIQNLLRRNHCEIIFLILKVKIWLFKINSLWKESRRLIIYNNSNDEPKFVI